MGTDADPLVDGAKAAENGMVLDGDMSGERGVVDENDVVADAAVMGDMSSDHDQATLADLGNEAAAFGARIHGDVFAHDGVGADHQPALLAAVLEVLRRQADAGKRKQLGPRSDLSAPVDDDMAFQRDAFGKRDIGADDTIGSDTDVVGKCCRRVDDRGRVDMGHSLPSHASTSMALISASATLPPATIASTRNFQMVPRLLIFATWYSTVSPGTTGLRNLALSMVMK